MSTSSRIEEVDVVWAGGLLHESVPSVEHGTFDACIASHVLEHVPDPVALFQSLDRLLKDDGRVSLAIPDKRRCFDFFKPLTSTGDLLEAHHRRQSRHSLRHLFEQTAYSVSSAGRICWERGPVPDVEFLLPLDAAKEAYETYGRADDVYIDCHAWYFTPSSFELAMLELLALGVLPFSITQRPPPEGCEFYVTLERASAAVDGDLSARRLELMIQTLVEQQEQPEFVGRALQPVDQQRRLTARLRALRPR